MGIDLKKINKTVKMSDLNVGEVLCVNETNWLVIDFDADEGLIMLCYEDEMPIMYELLSSNNIGYVGSHLEEVLNHLLSTFVEPAFKEIDVELQPFKMVFNDGTYCNSKIGTFTWETVTLYTDFLSKYAKNKQYWLAESGLFDNNREMPTFLVNNKEVFYPIAKDKTEICKVLPIVIAKFKPEYDIYFVFEGWGRSKFENKSLGVTYDLEK